MNEVNQFFARFDELDFSVFDDRILASLMQSSNAECSPAMVITENEVRQQLKCLKINKAAGPDGIHPRTLKMCADQLCSVLHLIFSLSLSSSKIPVMWKTSCLVPIPKHGSIGRGFSNLRPIALTSHLMKCFERIIISHLNTQSVFQDPLQFAYRKGVGVDDALLFMLHNMYSHLETTASSVRIMFFDFSSAFNTIQPHVLADKLMLFNLHSTTIRWILDYLLNRPQFVRLGNRMSDMIITKTGAPQGTVLSPFLFALYTFDYRHTQTSCCLQKFSDDTALVGLINRNNDLDYRREVELFVKWCDENVLKLNVEKTKELIIDFRRNKEAILLVTINGQNIEIVQSYKYLGVHLDSKLNWKRNSEVVFKKAQSRLFFLRKLSSIGIGRKLLYVFYQGILASVLFYSVLCWGGSITVEDKNRINKMIRKAGSIIVFIPDSLEVIVEKRTRATLKMIFNSEGHPLNYIFSGLKSSFSERLVMPRCSTERFRRYFIPNAVRFFLMKWCN